MRDIEDFTNEKVAFEIGDLVIPNDQQLTLSRREADEFGIITRIHKPFRHPKIKIFYWVKWNGAKREFVHFDHELVLLEKGKKNKC